MHKYKVEQLEKLIFEDLKELNACYSIKAYKATLILAGSILEAVLIDWLSEIDGKNYFEEEEDIGTLNKYIKRIQKLKPPVWMEKEGEKAHIIRQERNLVHAKLCLKSEYKINDETCKMVIGYLEDILKSRE